MKKIVFIFGLIVGLFAQNSSVNIQLTDSTLGIYAQSGLNQENVKIRGFYLYNDNSNKHNFYSLGIKAEGNLVGVEVENIRFSLITDFVHTKDNSALSLGFGIFSFIPQIELPIYIRSEIEYAPKVLSFDDANRFSRVDVSIGYIPIENGDVFLGYRILSFDNNYNSAFYFGLGYSF